MKAFLTICTSLTSSCELLITTPPRFILTLIHPLDTCPTLLVVFGVIISGPFSPTRYDFPAITVPPNARFPVIALPTELTAFETPFPIFPASSPADATSDVIVLIAPFAKSNILCSFDLTPEVNESIIVNTHVLIAFHASVNNILIASHKSANRWRISAHITFIASPKATIHSAVSCSNKSKASLICPTIVCDSSHSSPILACNCPICFLYSSAVIFPDLNESLRACICNSVSAIASVGQPLVKYNNAQAIASSIAGHPDKSNNHAYKLLTALDTARNHAVIDGIITPIVPKIVISHASAHARSTSLPNNSGFAAAQSENF